MTKEKTLDSIEDTTAPDTPDYSALERFLETKGITIDDALYKLRNRDMDQFLEKYDINQSDLVSILKSARGSLVATKKLNISGKHFKYGYFSDPHIGHKEFRGQLWDKMIRYFKREKPDFILTPGDHLEGMSHRVGHVYNLNEIGYHAQIKKAVDLYSELPSPTFGIDGNHDQWYFKPQNMGVIVGEDLERRVEGKGYTHLGQQEGDIEPAPGVTIKLFHANDGTAYAMSYKMQKLIESFTGGDKPNIVMSGHYHKALSMSIRNVVGFECGTLCGQTEWMRGKKIAAHMGFGMIDVYYNARGVDRIIHEWIPHYE